MFTCVLRRIFCLHSLINTQTFPRALTASVDRCVEIKGAPSVASPVTAESGKRVPESDAWSVKPVLNWANVSSRTYLEVFGEARWFLIGPTFLREPCWKYSSKLYSGPKSFALRVPLWSVCASQTTPGFCRGFHSLFKLLHLQ